MATAEVGDDVYGEDPTVNALEAEVAALFGHEAALFAPTGSMANQIALQLLVPPGDELLCDADAHVVTYEIGAAAAYGGISSRTWPAGRRGPRPGRGRRDDPAGRLLRGADPGDRRRADPQPGRRRGDPAGHAAASCARVADDAGVGAALRRRPDLARARRRRGAAGQYGALFDTLSVCLSKGLGAPVGSLVVGSAEKIDRARLIRKRMGGGMRQAGILAAAGRYALAHHVEPARRRPRQGAPGWPRRSRRSGCSPRPVRTNIVAAGPDQARRWTRAPSPPPPARRAC